MRRLSPAPVLLALLCATAAPARTTNDTPDKDLAGRTPGKPTNCIPRTQIDGSTLYHDGQILFRMKGGPDYLNKGGPGCASNAVNAALISVAPATQLCSGDVQSVVGPTTGMFYGSCPLGDFTPYPRAKTSRP